VGFCQAANELNFPSLEAYVEAKVEAKAGISRFFGWGSKK
jgi:hypothetical protein